MIGELRGIEFWCRYEGCLASPLVGLSFASNLVLIEKDP